MFVILFWVLSLPVIAFEAVMNGNALASPVLDAKEAYSRGNSDLVGIQLKEELLLPGIKPKDQERIRKQYSIRPLNRHWRTLKNAGRDTRELHSLKRYANRYNLMIMKLVKEEKVEQNSRYRY